jgi:hypothetical protein
MKEEDEWTNPLHLDDRLFDFAVRIINVVEVLPSSNSRYFTNQQSPIGNHQSNERACTAIS